MEVPLKVAGKARSVIEDSQEKGLGPLPVGQENPDKVGLVEVEVPKPSYILRFVTSSLALLPSFPSSGFTGSLASLLSLSRSQSASGQKAT